MVLEEGIIPPSGIAFVDVWASWCPPCAAFKVTFHAVAEDYTPQASFIEWDADLDAKVLIDYNITSLPTVLVFKNGEYTEKHVGKMTNKEFRNLVANFTSRPTL